MNFAYPTTPKLLTSSLVGVAFYTALCLAIGLGLRHGLLAWQTGWFFHAAEWGVATLVLLVLSYWLARER